MNSIDIHDATPEQYAAIDTPEESYGGFFWKRLTIGNITFRVHKPSEERTMVYTDELDEIRRKIIDVADREDTNVKAVIEDVEGGKIGFQPAFSLDFHCECGWPDCEAKFSVKERTKEGVTFIYTNEDGISTTTYLSPADAKRLAARLLILTEK